MPQVTTVIRRGACAAVVMLAALLAVAPGALASGGSGSGGGGGGGGSAQSVIGMFIDTNLPGASSSGSGLVDLDAAAPSNGCVVSLASSNPAALSVPATLIVPSG